MSDVCEADVPYSAYGTQEPRGGRPWRKGWASVLTLAINTL